MPPIKLRDSNKPILLPRDMPPLGNWERGVQLTNRIHGRAVLDPQYCPEPDGKGDYILYLPRERWLMLQRMLCPNRHCCCRSIVYRQEYRGALLRIFAPRQVSPILPDLVKHHPRIDATAKRLNRRLAYYRLTLRFEYDPEAHSWRTNDFPPRFSGLFTARQLRMAAATLLGQKITSRT